MSSIHEYQLDLYLAKLANVRPIYAYTKVTSKGQKCVAEDHCRGCRRPRRHRHKMLYTLIGWKDEVSSLPCRLQLPYLAYILLAQAGYHRDSVNETQKV